MKLTLVSITIDGIRHSKFVLSQDGKVDIYKAFPFLQFAPKGLTVTVG